MQLCPPSDDQLISDLRAGKAEALTGIFKRYWRPLYLNAFQKLRSHESAEELVQELFTELWDKREHLLSKPLNTLHLPSYLNRAIRNKVLNHIRRQLYDKKYWEYCRQQFSGSENSAHELAEYNDLQNNLHSAIAQLSHKTKQIFVLNKLEGVPVVQISRKLKLSEKAVGYHLTKSVRELKVYLRHFI
jgi:RNA polymerase sigma factor (sigma-70 family)